MRVPEKGAHLDRYLLGKGFQIAGRDYLESRPIADALGRARFLVPVLYTD